MYRINMQSLKLWKVDRYLQVRNYSDAVKNVSQLGKAAQLTPDVGRVRQDPSNPIAQVKISSNTNPMTIRPMSEPLPPLPISATMNLKIKSDSTVSFDEIPGPAVLRGIAKVWSVIPVVGTQLTATTVQYMLSAGKLFGSQISWIGGSWLLRRLLDEYGPVVRLHGPFGGDVVILSRPEHVSALFQTEGAYPIRSSLDSVENYRLKSRSYRQPGPFIAYGPEWEKMRKNLEQPLQNSIVDQASKVEHCCNDFIKRIASIRNKQEEVSYEFKNEVYKWCLECLISVVLNEKMGFLNPAGISSTSDPGRLLDGLFGATHAIRKIEYGPQFYKLFNTWAYKDLVKNCDMIDSVLRKHIKRSQESLLNQKDPKATSLLDSLLIKEGIVMEDVLTVFLDMMLIGVNATAHTVCFFLYNLAKNPRCQLKLFEEIHKQPYQNKFSSDSLKSMKYLQACIKESLRLNPPMPILSRVLSKEAVIHNYRIPKGTFILIASHLSSIREEHFEDAYKFKPERWLSSENEFASKDVQAFATIPFGYGPKGCLAQELAKMQIAMLMANLFKKFRIEYHYGTINTSFDKFLSPEKRPLRFRFIERN